MSARQPFVPSRPASRAVNLGEETRAIAKDAFAHAASTTSNNASITNSTEKKNSGLHHLDLEVESTLLPSTVTDAELIHNSNHRTPPIAPSTSPVSRNPLRAQLVPTPAQTPQQILDLALAQPIIRTKIKIWRMAVVAAAQVCWDVQRVRVSIAAARHHPRAYMRLARSPQAHPLLECRLRVLRRP